MLFRSIVGNSHGQDGVHDNTTVRVFSEGTKALETPAQANRRRYNGGELDAPSRNLARYLAQLAERHLTNFKVQMRIAIAGVRGDAVAGVADHLSRSHSVADFDVARPLDQVTVHRDVAVVEEDDAVVRR